MLCVHIIFFRPVPHGLGTVHLPLEHGQRLEGEGEVEKRGAGVDGHVVPVQVPVVVQPQDRLVLLQRGRELHKLIQGWRNLSRVSGSN